MVEKFKTYLKESFSNGPKAKIILGIIVGVAVVGTVTITTIRKTVVVSIDGEENKFVTYSRTVEGVLEDQGISLGQKDKIEPALETKLTEDEEISIKRAVPISLTIGDKRVSVDTAEETIGDVLKAEQESLTEQGITFNLEFDEITPAVDTKVEKDLSVCVVNVTEEEVVVAESLNYDTIVQEDSTLHYTYEEVKNQGKNGEKEVTYKIIKKNGKEVARTQVSEKVTSSPQNKLIVKGTMKTFSRGGINVPFKNKLVCESTAYWGDGTTATGRKPVYNPNGLSTISVDPRVIPLGSKVYVEGYGYAIAADTGGAIKGNKIDVYLNSAAACTAWGRKYGVSVYIIAYPGEW